MSYQRVLPRDLFNEAKLLKCLGKLALLVHDDLLQGLTMKFQDDLVWPGFLVAQRRGDGGLYCLNLNFWLSRSREPLVLYSAYNSKQPYPLLCEHHGETYDVFTDAGELTDEFQTLVAPGAHA